MNQAKQPADDLVASKKELDEEQAKLKIASKEAEDRMRAKAGTIGNLVAKDVPVSMTEVRDTMLNIVNPTQDDRMTTKL